MVGFRGPWGPDQKPTRSGRLRPAAATLWPSKVAAHRPPAGPACSSPRCATAGPTSWSGDTWEPVENLTNCEEAIAAFERATGRSLPRPAPHPPLAAGPAPPPPPPAGFTVDAAPPSDLGAALVRVGRQLLYWWPDDGWQRGSVARLCPRPAFSHVVAYTRQTSALRGTVDSLLDSASYGARWVLLSPAAVVGVRGRASSQP